MKTWSTAALVGAFLLAACSEKVSGTNDETHTEVSARIFLPDGTTPAVGAEVELVPVGGTAVAARGEVDASGRPVLSRVADGLYALSASSGPLASWSDSLRVVGGRLEAIDDTLRQAASISGVVALQPQHDLQTVVVNVLGTDAWANVGTDGRFTLPLLGAGVRRLKFTSTITEYTPLYQTVPLAPSQGFVFPDTLRLPYTGIPVVLGLRAVNDSATGDIVVSWSRARHANLVDYAIYRDSSGAVEWSSTPIASATDTFWRDVSAKAPDRVRTWRYRVAVRVSGAKDPGAWHQVATASSIPPQLAHLHDISWTSLGSPGGVLAGFLGGSSATASQEIGTDSVRVPSWATTEGTAWSLGGTSFPLRRMGQLVVRATGFGAGRLWSFGRSGIGDGVDVSWSVDGRAWAHAVIPDSLWPGDAELSVAGAAGRVALVAQGSTSSVVLSGDTLGNWHRATVAGHLLGLDDSGLWIDGGLRRVQRVDAATGRTVQRDLGVWSEPDPVTALVRCGGGLLVRAGTRLWAREGAAWTLRASPAVNAIAADADQLLVRDPFGTVWKGVP